MVFSNRFIDMMSEAMDSSKVLSQNPMVIQAESNKKKPSCIIVLGMAGSGKTTFVQRLVSVLYNVGKPYVINLDPACREVPYPANIGTSNVNEFSTFYVI